MNRCRRMLSSIALMGTTLSCSIPSSNALAAAGGSSDPRAAIAAAQAIPPGGINVLKTVEIGGIPQWINVRGSNPANPILLFVHGGPGSPMMPESWTFQRPWEDFFTVVQWDQRGAGKTFSTAKRQPDKALTIARMQADTEQLIELLRRTYGKQKIFLVAHSWGSVLGLKVAQHRPDLLYAYVGVGQVINGKRNEVVGYQETLAEAKAAGNQAAINELNAIAPYPNPNGPTSLEKVITERKWDVALGGMRYGRTKDNESQIRALSPAYGDGDEESAQTGAFVSAQALLPQAELVDFDKVNVFKCPVFFFAGLHDRTTPTTIVRDYFTKVVAPIKTLFIIDRAAHYVVDEAPGEVLVDLVNYVRPLANKK